MRAMVGSHIVHSVGGARLAQSGAPAWPFLWGHSRATPPVDLSHWGLDGERLGMQATDRAGCSGNLGTLRAVPRITLRHVVRRYTRASGGGGAGRRRLA